MPPGCGGNSEVTIRILFLVNEVIVYSLFLFSIQFSKFLPPGNYRDSREGGFDFSEEIKDGRAILFQFRFHFNFLLNLTPQSTPLPSTSTLPIANYYKPVPVQMAKETDLKTHLTATSLYYS